MRAGVRAVGRSPRSPRSTLRLCRRGSWEQPHAQPAAHLLRTNTLTQGFSRRAPCLRSLESHLSDNWYPVLQVSFLSAVQGNNHALDMFWYVMNRIIDSVFAIDICLQFFLMVRARTCTCEGTDGM